MLVPRISFSIFALLCSAACARQRIAPSLRGDFDVSGTYAVRVQPIAIGCKDVSSQPIDSRVDVQHPAGEARLTVVFEGDAYPSEIKPNGNFAADVVRRNRGGAVETVRMRGRISSSTFAALLEVDRGAVRTVLPTTRIHTEGPCRYHVNIDGARVAEGSH